MHAEVLDFLTRRGLPELAERTAVDVGGADWNGSARTLAPNIHWDIVDIADNDHVTLVHDITTGPVPGVWQTVVSTEMLEHVADWQTAVDSLKAMTAPGGHLWITAAAPPRPPHGATGAPTPADGEHYANIQPFALVKALEPFALVDFEYHLSPGDVYVHAVRL